MPTTTDGLPYPAYSDDPDVPGDLQALAEAVDAGYYTKTEADAKYRTITDSYTKAQVDTSFSTMFSGFTRVHMGTVSDTPAPGGALTIAHGAPFTPDYIMATAQDVDATLDTADGLTCNVASDTVGGANFSVRVNKNSNGAGHNQLCRIVFLCFKV